MNFKYRVKGKVDQGFVLRGFYHKVGEPIDACIYEGELQFVKSRCNPVEVEPIEKMNTVIDFPKPVLKEEKESEPEEKVEEEPVKEEEQSDEPSNNSHKRKSKKQI